MKKGVTFKVYHFPKDIHGNIDYENPMGYIINYWCRNDIVKNNDLGMYDLVFRDIVKCYLRNTPKQVADELIMVSGNVGCIVVGEYEKIKPLISSLKKDDYYLEIQNNSLPEQVMANQKLIMLSRQLGIPLVATNDAHYLKKEDAPIHKAFLNSQEGDREVDSFYATTYLMGTDEIEAYFTLYTDDYVLQKSFHYTTLLLLSYFRQEFLYRGEYMSCVRAKVFRWIAGYDHIV